MKKTRCPSCGRHEGVPLVRGSADEETRKAAQRGEVALAGCMMQPFGNAIPDYACLACSHRWDDEERR